MLINQWFDGILQYLLCIGLKSDQSVIPQIHHFPLSKVKHYICLFPVFLDLARPPLSFLLPSHVGTVQGILEIFCQEMQLVTHYKNSHSEPSERKKCLVFNTLAKCAKDCTLLVARPLKV